MRNFLTAWPLIELTLWNGTSAAVRNAVISREVHYGLVVNPQPHPDLVLTKLFEDAMDFFVSVDEPEVGSRAEALARIQRGPVVYSGRVAQCQDLLGLVSTEQCITARTLSCGDLELVKSLTLAGIGVGVIPRRVAGYGRHGGLRRLHPDLPFIPDTIYLAWRADTHRTVAATHVKESLLEYGRAMAHDLAPSAVNRP